MEVNGNNWTPSSWKSKPIKQEVIYDDQKSFGKALSKLEHLPPLVTPKEIDKLKKELREVALGNAFLLQGGDCAELFDYCNQDMIEAKVKLLLQMSLVLIYGARKKVVRVARMAGQFAKPRSSPMETIDGVTMSSFRGDILNSYEPDPKLRSPDPSRLVDAYFHSAATLNYLRAALSSGLADLHAPLDWSLGHVLDPEVRDKYQRIVSKITDTLEMMRTIGLDTGGGLETVDLFTSHEGLLLEYEQALTRPFTNQSNVSQSPLSNSTNHSNNHNNNHTNNHINNHNHTSTNNYNHSHKRSQSNSQPTTKSYYDTSAHFLWIGDRTRQLTYGHIEFFRGITNPIGIKIGPTMLTKDLIPLLDILNPNYEIGKIVLITRYGHDKIEKFLPDHILSIQSSKHKNTIVWQCDPMHGNGRNAILPSEEKEKDEKNKSTTIKTRHFQDILKELKLALKIHRDLGSYLGGVHLELTGEAVTECLGGSEELTEKDLSLNYTSFCDPRLNEKQALELAFLVAGFYRD